MLEHLYFVSEMLGSQFAFHEAEIQENRKAKAEAIRKIYEEFRRKAGAKNL